MANRIEITLIALLGLVFVGCSSTDNPSSTNGDETYYKTEIQTILNQSCATSGCHDSQTKTNGVNLSSYEAVMASSGQDYGRKVVTPGDAENSPLIDVIMAERKINIPRMPFNRSPLSDAKIQKLREWVANGATNE
jgi:hypothetical protein